MVFLSYFVLTSLLLNSNFLSLFLIIFFLSILLSLAAGRRLMQFMFFFAASSRCWGQFAAMPFNLYPPLFVCTEIFLKNEIRVNLFRIAFKS